jgi:lipoate-protein ligase A
MKYLDLTLPTPHANLALDEALLHACEAGEGPEVLRLWRPTAPLVVLGYANEPATEVNLLACAAEGIPILRRCSGGGTVLLSPGTLCYAVVLQMARDPALESISGANRYVLQRVARAARSATGAAVTIDGDTDLVVDGRKCAGNAQRRLRHTLLFHGSLLVNADFRQIARCLPMPSRQPGYRSGRTHEDFLRNLGGDMPPLQAALRAEWEAQETSSAPPLERMQALMAAAPSRLTGGSVRGPMAS